MILGRRQFACLYFGMPANPIEICLSLCEKQNLYQEGLRYGYRFRLRLQVNCSLLRH